jgi:hypothetical protein
VLRAHHATAVEDTDILRWDVMGETVVEISNDLLQGTRFPVLPSLLAVTRQSVSS